MTFLAERFFLSSFWDCIVCRARAPSFGKGHTWRFISNCVSSALRMRLEMNSPVDIFALISDWFFFLHRYCRYTCDMSAIVSQPASTSEWTNKEEIGAFLQKSSTIDGFRVKAISNILLWFFFSLIVFRFVRPIRKWPIKISQKIQSKLWTHTQKNIWLLLMYLILIVWGATVIQITICNYLSSWEFNLLIVCINIKCTKMNCITYTHDSWNCNKAQLLIRYLYWNWINYTLTMKSRNRFGAITSSERKTCASCFVTLMSCLICDLSLM